MTLLVVCGLIVFFAVMLAPRWLLGLLDRFRRRIVVVGVTAVVIAALVLYFEPGDTVKDYNAILSVRNATPEAFDAKLEARLEQPGIDAPIYFHYVNGEAVDILYNQLKPELEETSRDIKSSATVKGGAEITAGNGKVSIEGNKSGEEESKYNRPSFLPARECLEVMKYVRRTWPTNYYADYDDWWSKYTTSRILHAGSDSSVYDPQDPLKTPYNLEEDLTHQAAENARRIINKLKEQLSTVHGRVFVDGDFEKSVEGNNVVLMHTLSIPDKMPKLDATFKIVLPKAAVQSLPTGKPLRLRVFGDVTKPLGKDGFINVAPVAIF